MFDNLIESKPKKQRSVGQTLMSIVLHTLVITLAIRATQGAAEVMQKINDGPTDFILPPEPPPPPPPPPEEIPPDVIVTNNPPPQGFQTLVPPKDLPTEIPPIDLNEKFDARDYSGIGVEGGIADGIVGAPAIPDGVISSSQAFTQSDVDDPATRISGPDPVYPSMMRDVGIDGSVRLQFVVGINGKAEAASISVISSTNKAFERNAIETIRKSTFRPAKIGGKPVRQLVQQLITFSLTG